MSYVLRHGRTHTHIDQTIVRSPPTDLCVAFSIRLQTIVISIRTRSNIQQYTISISEQMGEKNKQFFRIVHHRGSMCTFGISEQQQHGCDCAKSNEVHSAVRMCESKWFSLRLNMCICTRNIMHNHRFIFTRVFNASKMFLIKKHIHMHSVLYLLHSSLVEKLMLQLSYTLQNYRLQQQ